MRKTITAILLALVTIATLVTSVHAAMPRDASRTQLDTAIRDTADFLLRNVPNPDVGTLGGEWAVLGLARSGRPLPEGFLEDYIYNVESHLRASGGVLDSRRLTEYSRVILGLTAAGADPRDVSGQNLLQPLADLERTTWQGTNGAIFALLAFDSAGYAIPQNTRAGAQTTREALVSAILSRQLPDGGFSLVELDDPTARSEVDITAMALQALAKYQDQRDVRTSINRALTFLSRRQNTDGGFSNGQTPATNTESTVQVLVALGELGIPITEPRFINNGNSILGSLLALQNADGGFRHSPNHPQTNLMSTEQALYGLVSAQRALDGQDSLYRMMNE